MGPIEYPIRRLSKVSTREIELNSHSLWNLSSAYVENKAYLTDAYLRHSPWMSKEMK